MDEIPIVRGKLREMLDLRSKYAPCGRSFVEKSLEKTRAKVRDRLGQRDPLNYFMDDTGVVCVYNVTLAARAQEQAENEKAGPSEMGKGAQGEESGQKSGFPKLDPQGTDAVVKKGSRDTEDSVAFGPPSHGNSKTRPDAAVPDSSAFRKHYSLFSVPTLEEFYGDLSRVAEIRCDGPVRSYTHTRLKLLEKKFELYRMLHYGDETKENKSNGVDFNHVVKVDNHIHHSAAMCSSHLFSFMRKKFLENKNDVVEWRGEQVKTLADFCKALEVEESALNLDAFEMQADHRVMSRFDIFNSRFSPLGKSAFREVFLKTDNQMGGRYLAELTRELIAGLERREWCHTEWRLSIYGKNPEEWTKLARWVLQEKQHSGRGQPAPKGQPTATQDPPSPPRALDFNLPTTTQSPLLCEKNRWMIQFPRLFQLYRKLSIVKNFKQWLQNLFLPLFEATLFPEKNPDLAEFLKHVGAFDTVDDESQEEAVALQTAVANDRRNRLITDPGHWSFENANPPYAYYSYFIYANIKTLNELRGKLGLNQFHYRPHCGEAGDLLNLDVGFLLADSIAHGIRLKHSPVMQYCYYLTQIGISVSPQSNNALFLEYAKNPFFAFFKRGLNCTLSTDDPVMFHNTREPLLEEYAVARTYWRLSPVDVCEIARNSVRQSSFPLDVKLKWLGLGGLAEFFASNKKIGRMAEEICGRVNNNDVTNVPNSRQHFRQTCLRTERESILGSGSMKTKVRLEEILGGSTLSNKSTSGGTITNRLDEFSIPGMNSDPMAELNALLAEEKNMALAAVVEEADMALAGATTCCGVDEVQTQTQSQDTFVVQTSEVSVSEQKENGRLSAGSVGSGFSAASSEVKKQRTLSGETMKMLYAARVPLSQAELEQMQSVGGSDGEEGVGGVVAARAYSSVGSGAVSETQQSSKRPPSLVDHSANPPASPNPAPLGNYNVSGASLNTDVLGTMLAISTEGGKEIRGTLALLKLKEREQHVPSPRVMKRPTSSSYGTEIAGAWGVREPGDRLMRRGRGSDSSLSSDDDGGDAERAVADVELPLMNGDERCPSGEAGTSSSTADDAEEDIMIAKELKRPRISDSGSMSQALRVVRAEGSAVVDATTSENRVGCGRKLYPSELFKPPMTFFTEDDLTASPTATTSPRENNQTASAPPPTAVVAGSGSAREQVTHSQIFQPARAAAASASAVSGAPSAAPATGKSSKSSNFLGSTLLELSGDEAEGRLLSARAAKDRRDSKSNTGNKNKNSENMTMLADKIRSLEADLQAHFQEAALVQETAKKARQHIMGLHVDTSASHRLPSLLTDGYQDAGYEYYKRSTALGGRQRSRTTPPPEEITPRGSTAGLLGSGTGFAVDSAAAAEVFRPYYNSTLVSGDGVPSSSSSPRNSPSHNSKRTTPPVEATSPRRSSKPESAQIPSSPTMEATPTLFPSGDGRSLLLHSPFDMALAATPAVTDVFSPPRTNSGPERLDLQRRTLTSGPRVNLDGSYSEKVAGLNPVQQLVLELPAGSKNSLQSNSPPLVSRDVSPRERAQLEFLKTEKLFQRISQHADATEFPTTQFQGENYFFTETGRRLERLELQTRTLLESERSLLMSPVGGGGPVERGVSPSSSPEGGGGRHEVAPTAATTALRTMQEENRNPLQSDYARGKQTLLAAKAMGGSNSEPISRSAKIMSARAASGSPTGSRNQLERLESAADRQISAGIEEAEASRFDAGAPAPLQSAVAQPQQIAAAPSPLAAPTPRRQNQSPRIQERGLSPPTHQMTSATTTGNLYPAEMNSMTQLGSSPGSSDQRFSSTFTRKPVNVLDNTFDSRLGMSTWGFTSSLKYDDRKLQDVLKLEQLPHRLQFDGKFPQHDVIEGLGNQTVQRMLNNAVVDREVRERLLEGESGSRMDEEAVAPDFLNRSTSAVSASSRQRDVDSKVASWMQHDLPMREERQQLEREQAIEAEKRRTPLCSHKHFGATENGGGGSVSSYTPAELAHFRLAENTWYAADLVGRTRAASGESGVRRAESRQRMDEARMSRSLERIAELDEGNIQLPPPPIFEDFSASDKNIATDLKIQYAKPNVELGNMTAAGDWALDRNKFRKFVERSKIVGGIPSVVTAREQLKARESRKQGSYLGRKMSGRSSRTPPPPSLAWRRGVEVPPEPTSTTSFGELSTTSSRRRAVTPSPAMGASLMRSMGGITGISTPVANLNLVPPASIPGVSLAPGFAFSHREREIPSSYVGTAHYASHAQDLHDSEVLAASGRRVSAPGERFDSAVNPLVTTSSKRWEQQQAQSPRSTTATILPGNARTSASGGFPPDDNFVNDCSCSKASVATILPLSPIPEKIVADQVLRTPRCSAVESLGEGYGRVPDLVYLATAAEFRESAEVRGDGQAQAQEEMDKLGKLREQQETESCAIM